MFTKRLLAIFAACAFSTVAAAAEAPKDEPKAEKAQDKEKVKKGAKKEKAEAKKPQKPKPEGC